jgi:hypothetical protein
LKVCLTMTLAPLAVTCLCDFFLFVYISTSWLFNKYMKPIIHSYTLPVNAVFMSQINIGCCDIIVY